MARRSSRSSRIAAILVLALVAVLVTLLVSCPPNRGPSAANPGAPALPPVRPQDNRPAPPAIAPAETWGSTPPSTPPVGRGSTPPERPQLEGRLAIIIDDAGYSLEELDEFLALPGPLTVSVLPNLPHSREAAHRILAAGKDLLLHEPMEPEGGEDPGPGALRTGQTPQEIAHLLDQAFASVPAPGMNNHMGSKATADPAVMFAVMEYLKRDGKFFVDSRTTSDTVGPAEAAAAGVPFLQRNVFIDAGRSKEEIALAFDRGVSEARQRGASILIGHVQDRGVLAILREREGSLSAAGVHLVHLRELLGQ